MARFPLRPGFRRLRAGVRHHEIRQSDVYCGRGLQRSGAGKNLIEKALERGWINQTYDVEVPARTLTSILDEVVPPRIDLFSLDVEHFELSVLAGIDFNRYSPRYLLVETYWPDKVAALLPGKYRQIEQISSMDFLFGLRPAFQG